MERGDYACQFAVAGAFTVAIDRSLHLSRPRLDSCNGIGNPKAAVIVRVYSQWAAQPLSCQARDPCDLRRKSSTIGVAEHHTTRPGLFRRLPCGQCVIGFIAEAVEAVLGVVDDLFSMILQVPDRI